MTAETNNCILRSRVHDLKRGWNVTHGYRPDSSIFSSLSFYLSLDLTEISPRNAGSCSLGKKYFLSSEESCCVHSTLGNMDKGCLPQSLLSVGGGGIPLLE